MTAKDSDDDVEDLIHTLELVVEVFISRQALLADILKAVVDRRFSRAYDLAEKLAAIDTQQVVMVAKDFVAEAADHPRGDEIDRFIAQREMVTTNEILEHLGIDTSKGTQREQNQISAHMKRRGWRKGRQYVDDTRLRVWARSETTPPAAGSDEAPF